MTKNELDKIEEISKIVYESAEGIKWLKSAIESNALIGSKEYSYIVEQLIIINGKVQRNTTRSTVNRYSLLGAFAVEGIIITVLLHLMGIY